MTSIPKSVIFSMSANFLSPNSYSFDKFARLQDYFMSSLGQEGFQVQTCNTNEYGMAVLHEPFQDESTTATATMTQGVVDKYLFKWENKNKNSLLTQDELSYTDGMPLESQYIPSSSQAETTTTTSTTINPMPTMEETTTTSTTINPMPTMKETTTTQPETTTSTTTIPTMEDTTTTTPITSTIPTTTTQPTKNDKLRYKSYINNYSKFCNPKSKDYDEEKCAETKTNINEYKKDTQEIKLKSKPKSKPKSNNEAFSVDEGLNNESAKNKIYTSNKKLVNKPKPKTDLAKDKMSNSRNNNNMRNNRSVTEEDEMETTTTGMEAEMMDEDMETTTTRKATTSSKKAKKAAKREMSDMEEEETTTSTTEMATSEEDGDMAMNNGTERGPEGDMESEPEEESVTEGFSGSRTYRFGHLSTALKALLLALLFWLLTNEAGCRYVSKLAKRLGASTCVIQVIVFFVLAYIALML